MSSQGKNALLIMMTLALAAVSVVAYRASRVSDGAAGKGLAGLSTEVFAGDNGGFNLEMEALKQAGLKDPLRELREDLVQRQTELIPYQGLNGSRMRFQEVYFLKNQRVLAEFEDGHIGGYAILRYDAANGSISWEVLGKCLDGMSDGEYEEMRQAE